MIISMNLVSKLTHNWYGLIIRGRSVSKIHVPMRYSVICPTIYKYVNHWRSVIALMIISDINFENVRHGRWDDFVSLQNCFSVSRIAFRLKRFVGT